MSDVKRWEPENTFLGYNMRPDAEGSFVLHDAYAKLEAEAQALREQVAALREDHDKEWRRAGIAEENLQAALRARVVVVPDELNAEECHSEWDAGRARGWSDCLDELARLNGKAVSEGLLLRIIQHLEWNGTDDQDITVMDYVRRGDSMAEELRTLIGKGKEVGDVPSA